MFTLHPPAKLCCVFIVQHDLRWLAGVQMSKHFTTFSEQKKHLRNNYLDDGRPSGQMCRTDAHW